MISVTELYLEDVSEQDVTRVGGGKELRGPCPGCGGNDRFGVHAHQNGGLGSFFCGRYKGAANTGCGKGGDNIQYLIDFRGMSYVEACGYLGIEPKNTRKRSHHHYSLPKQSKKAAPAPGFVPDAKDHPAEVVDVARWREHGMKFVERCHQHLMDNPVMQAYLMQRGISQEVMVQYQLGYHPGKERNGKKLQPDFRPWPSWGLRDEKNEKGRTRALALHAGIVIPFIVDGQLHRITVRKAKLNNPNEPRYDYVKGSIRDLWLSDAGTGNFITAEAELDCLAIISAAGDLVGAVGIGSTGVKPDKRAASALARAKCILGSLDRDKPRKNAKTGRIEAPGPMAEQWWKQQYGGKYLRWPVPKGKDPGEAYEAGLNLRVWIMAGLQKGGVGQAQPAPKVERQEPQPAHVAQVTELQLTNGKVIYLTNDHDLWREYSQQKKPVFTGQELERLKAATADLDQQAALAEAMRVVEVKEVMGGFIKRGELVAGKVEVDQ